MTTFFYTAHGYKAVVISPIVDLVGSPIESIEYRTIPLCGGQKEPFVACKRGHQLLFNEVVDIVDNTQDQVCVAVPTIFYIAQDKRKKYNKYWAQKNHFMSIDAVSDQGKIPTSLASDIQLDTNTVVLIAPYRDTNHDIIYSVGTRFVSAPSKKKEKNISAWAFNKAKNKFDTITIPQEQCYLDKAQTIPQKIDCFVRLVQQWAHSKEGYIPYVWGGSSYTQLAQSPVITEKQIHKNNKEQSFYCIEQYNVYPMSGFDCSSLITRAAQICGIPYYFKNTTTLSHFLSELNTDDLIENGDLIWIPWHVMIVSDITKNLLVEARSYNHDFGKVHELPLHKVFKGIHTYQDLKQRLFAKKPLERIDKTGIVRDTFFTFKILKMKSVFS